MAQTGVERNQELRDGAIYVDARSPEQRFGDWLFEKNNIRNVLGGMAAFGVVLPTSIPAVLTVGFFTYHWWAWRIKRYRMPIRYPEWCGIKDPSEMADNAGIRNGRGIEFIGVERKGRTQKTTEEIWASDSDARTHRIYFGTTGAGKTEILLSTLYNPLCWGSGFSMTDGKAQMDVAAKIFVMARMFWREDDVLILNYMRGGQDRFKEMVNKRPVGLRKTRVSNTWNPFGTANHETINQIIDSIMEKASGDGAQWQAKAISMKNALVQTIAYLRAKGDMLMSVSAIREQMALDNMVKLAMIPDLPPAAAAAIRSYLSSGLPGFSWPKALAGKPQDQDTLLQHGYLTGQFTRTLGLMTDTYFDIFGDEIPEYDTSDVILNNRISLTMIPTLEKGVEEAGNLGKMQVASAKMMMSENLGYEIEGDYEDVVDNRPTNSRRPFYLVMDELGYYFAPGIDLMFAQGRSLQIALIAAAQDFQAMAKTFKSEVESMVANTRLKFALKLEDPKETYEIIEKSGGQGEVAKLSGYETSEPGAFETAGQHRRNKSASIERTSRISLQELKDLGAGDGVLIYGSKIIRFKSFNLFLKYKFDKKKVNLRINTFVPVYKPDAHEISSMGPDMCKAVSNDSESISARLMSLLRGGRSFNWSSESVALASGDPVIRGIVDAAESMSARPNIPAHHRGIVLFMAALAGLEKVVPLEPEPFVMLDPKTGEMAGARAGRSQRREGMVSIVVDESIPDSVEIPAGEENEPAFVSKKMDLDDGFLRKPPIEVCKRDDLESLLNPVWGKSEESNSDDEDEDDIVFGVDSAPPEALGGRSNLAIKFSPEAEAAIGSLATQMCDGDERAASMEIEATRKMVDSVCQFGFAGQGTKDDPTSNGSADDVIGLLDGLMDELSS